MEKIMKKIDGLNTNKWKAIEFFKENLNWNKAGKGQWDSQDVWRWIKWHVKQLGRDRNDVSDLYMWYHRPQWKVLFSSLTA
jgi:hypothetical protein